MRNILLQIGAGSYSQELLLTTLKLACQCKADIIVGILIHAPIQDKMMNIADSGQTVLEEDPENDYQGLFKDLVDLQEYRNTFKPRISSLELQESETHSLCNIIINHNIWLIVMAKPEIYQLKDISDRHFSPDLINKINCPVLLIPEHIDCAPFSQIAYATDLRYCDLGILRFLKVFNVSIYLTNISAPGLPDMEEKHAQDILYNTICVASNYSKLFLRNIKTKDIPKVIENEFAVIGINLLAFFNKKHDMLTRLIGDVPGKIQSCHHLPFLIFPYSNWYDRSIFYQ